MGPMNSAEQREKISQIVEETRENKEGTILSGGSTLKGTAYEHGYFYRPTLVSNVVPDQDL